jgi:hypothetical protein
LDADRAPQLKAIYKAGQEKKERTHPKGAAWGFVFALQHPVVWFRNVVRVIAPFIKLLLVLPFSYCLSFGFLRRAS